VVFGSYCTCNWNYFDVCGPIDRAPVSDNGTNCIRRPVSGGWAKATLGDLASVPCAACNERRGRSGRLRPPSVESSRNPTDCFGGLDASWMLWKKCCFSGGSGCVGGSVESG
jgi:hypothetical protein